MHYAQISTAWFRVRSNSWLMGNQVVVLWTISELEHVVLAEVVSKLPILS